MHKIEFIYKKKGCHKIFKTYNYEKKIIKNCIEKQLIQKIQTNFFKIKSAIKPKINGHKCYECKINIPKLPPVRIAFIIQNNRIIIFYITTDIIKKQFSKVLKNFTN